MQKVLIIGAGAAGLSAARVLVESDYEVEIFELDSKVGGLSKSFALFEQIVDVGPHRFLAKTSGSMTFGSPTQQARISK